MEVALACAVSFAAGLVQGALGLGFAILSVPILTVIDPTLTPIPQILIALPIVVYMAWREWDHVDMEGVWWIVAGRVPGAVIGAWLLAAVSGRSLDLIIAATVLGVVIVLATGWHVQLSHSTRFAAGFVAGIIGTTSAIGGPPIALLYSRSSAETLRSSLSAVFAIGIAINLIVLVAADRVSGSDLAIALLLLSPTALGVLSSRLVTGFLNGPALRVGVLGLSVGSAIALLVKTLA